MTAASRKPRLICVAGVWHCAGIPGRSPADAYDRWLIAMTVPCGFVPRVRSPA